MTWRANARGEVRGGSGERVAMRQRYARYGAYNIRVVTARQRSPVRAVTRRSKMHAVRVCASTRMRLLRARQARQLLFVTRERVMQPRHSVGGQCRVAGRVGEGVWSNVWVVARWCPACAPNRGCARANGYRLHRAWSTSCRRRVRRRAHVPCQAYAFPPVST